MSDNHTCHAIDCKAHVKPEMLMCYRHWKMVPKRLQSAVWSTYRVGQCDDWKPSKEYCNAAKAAVLYVARAEGKNPDDNHPNLKLYDLFAARDAETPSKRGLIREDTVREVRLLKLPPLALSDIDDPDLRENVSTIASNYLSNNQTISFLKSEQNNDKKTLNELLDGTPYAGRSIISDTFRLTTSTKKTKKIDPAKLLELGVSMDVIKQATVEIESAPYWTISYPNEKRKKSDNGDDD